jgi:hypothetical protein
LHRRGFENLSQRGHSQGLEASGHVFLVALVLAFMANGYLIAVQ